jgi:hypothetical protein
MRLADQGTNMPVYLRYLFTILLFGYLALLEPVTVARADGPVIEAQVNVPYVVQFGFGSYSVGGITTNTYRIPLTHTFAPGVEQDDWRLKLTVYLGYTHVDFETPLLGPKLSASQEYAFVLPQVELLIPLQPGWLLKPYVSLGSGYGFNGTIQLEGYRRESLADGFDILYATGVGTLYELELQSFNVSLGSRLGWAGEILVDGGKDQGFGTFQAGLEIRHPLGISLAGKQIDLAGSFIYYYFFPAAEFSMPGERPLKVSNQYEFGATLGMAKPSKVWIFENPQIGASYRFGDGMTGFRLNLGFPF